MVANASDSYQFSPDLVDRLLTDKEQRGRFHRLLLLSLSLYSVYHLTYSWMSRYKKNLSKKDKELVKVWKNSLTYNQPLKWDNVELDPERLKGLFELYFEQSAEKGRRQKEKFEEFSLEYALSQVFSPKQKELFKKRLKGLPLSKTEKEYYSRTVKKKVVALANSELHSLSRKLLEQ